MKTSILTAMLVLTAVSGVVVASDAAKAQAWMDIARNPVPSYQPFRGYNGAQTYIGQDYNSPRASGPGEALRSDPGDALEGDAVDNALENLEADCP